MREADRLWLPRRDGEARIAMRRCGRVSCARKAQSRRDRLHLSAQYGGEGQHVRQEGARAGTHPRERSWDRISSPGAARRPNRAGRGHAPLVQGWPALSIRSLFHDARRGRPDVRCHGSFRIPRFAQPRFAAPSPANTTRWEPRNRNLVGQVKLQVASLVRKTTLFQHHAHILGTLLRPSLWSAEILRPTWERKMKDEHSKAAEHHGSTTKSHRAAAEATARTTTPRARNTRHEPNSTRKTPAIIPRRRTPRARNRSRLFPPGSEGSRVGFPVGLARIE